MEVKKMHYNNVIIGIVDENENELFSLTPVNFYKLYDKLSSFLGIVKEYKRPKLYATKSDSPHYYADVKKVWSRYAILIMDKANVFSYNYGEYSLEELKEMHIAMTEYVLSADKDMIFSCSSHDISNISHTPYTIYKDVYPNTDLTNDMFVFFIVVGEWYYSSRTLQENIEHIHTKFEGFSDSIRKHPTFQMIEKRNRDNNFTDKDYESAFRLVNNYKRI